MLSLRRKISCQEVVELLTDYLDGKLPAPARRRLDAHLRGCGNCSAYLAQIRATIRLTGRVTPDDLSAPAREELTELYRRWREG